MNRETIIVGCCGFPTSMKKYAELFNVVELQSTFYDIPRRSTVENWRKRVPSHFEFTVKAFQGITHPPSSPTWRRCRIPVDQRANYGMFKPTKEVMEAWNTMLEICKILKAKVCIFQTPAAFKATNENIENLKTFFTEIDRGNLILCWEPRGAGWTRDIVYDICRELSLVHVTDPFKELPSYVSEIAYLRLHGCPPGKRMYVYKYSDGDLKTLYEKCEHMAERVNKVYVMFNNINMLEDAIRFSKYLSEGEFMKVLWGAEAIIEAIKRRVGFPTRKSDILEKAGRMKIFIKPDTRIQVASVVSKIEDKLYESPEDLKAEIEKALTI